MSKYVKNLIADHLRERLQGVDEALLVNVVGLDANANNRLRTELQAKDINLMAVKNSLAARATEGTPLAAMFEGLTGTAAICWGGEDIVSLAKEVLRLAKDEQFASFEPRGGLMDGQRLSGAEVAEVSSWPSRTEQLSVLLGQILSPGANLASQLTGPAGGLASQIEQLAEQPQQNGQEGSGE
ncbi:MAG: 50S ribosomal protein L10 [Planctomycetota bacterium]|jgi:ribosomal protein L10